MTGFQKRHSPVLFLVYSINEPKLSMKGHIAFQITGCYLSQYQSLVTLTIKRFFESNDSQATYAYDVIHKRNT